MSFISSSISAVFLPEPLAKIQKNPILKKNIGKYLFVLFSYFSLSPCSA